MAARASGARIFARQASDRTREGAWQDTRGAEPVATVVRGAWSRSAVHTVCAGTCSEARCRATAQARRLDRSRAVGCWLRKRCLDWADDRRPDRRQVRRSIPQASCAAPVAPAWLFCAATAQATRSCRPRSAGVLAQDALPRDQKKAAACRGVVMFGDEASFWLDGSLHRTWSRVGVQPRVDTFGARKTAHVFGVVTLEPRPLFLWRFAPVFNSRTFLEFLQELVRRCSRRKLFLIIDNGPCHNLDADGKAWLRENAGRIELCRLPPYSPEFNPIEGVWKVTKKRTTHNRFFHTAAERDAALVSTFQTLGQCHFCSLGKPVASRGWARGGVGSVCERGLLVEECLLPLGPLGMATGWWAER